MNRPRATPALLSSMLCVVLGAAAVGCLPDEEHASVDVTLRADGYALFAIDNERQQHDDVSITVRDVDPDATYVLLYSEDAPRNVGWFLLDPAAKPPCGGDPGAYCELPGYGYMVDLVKVPTGARSITLRDVRCGCDRKRDSSSWTGHWAVMRVERTNRASPMTLSVRTRALKSYAVEPEVRQLQ